MIISNEDIYCRCKCQAVSHQFAARWRLLGHICRRGEHIPAQLAMKSYFAPGDKFHGRPNTSFATITDQDIASFKDHIQITATITSLIIVKVQFYSVNAFYIENTQCWVWHLQKKLHNNIVRCNVSNKINRVGTQATHVPIGHIEIKT